MRKKAGTLLAALLAGALAAQAQPPAYMRKAKEIQAEARNMQENSRKNPQQVPDFEENKPAVPSKTGKSSSRAHAHSNGAENEEDNAAPGNATAKMGAQDVMKAASSGNLGELQLLESKGYSLTAPDAEQNTPLHMAAYKNQKAVVDYLLSRPGILKDPLDKRGTTPLMLAAGAGNLSCVESLLASGCDFKIKAPDGSTALHRAAAQGQLAVVDKLLEAGADPAATDAKGNTPDKLAQQKKKGDWESVISHLKQAQSNQP
ncbi:MAG: ankyrin repeat domain-containing protein [Candidatus Eremiobacteraeota bacterium]|nr:ankyrin repeat domain-containing protein [Candidatus Eremiobacteraeota bacterium]MCW5871942.1 ankyrin repeat domain-containing protein [Candidatus Eremiobacteraeota bacterium]